MDRAFSTGLFIAAILSFGGAVLLLLNGFIEYLQVGRWQAVSLLEVAYESNLIRAGWFLRHEWSRWVHDVLEAVPVYAALLGFAPVAWWFSGRFGSR